MLLVLLVLMLLVLLVLMLLVLVLCIYIGGQRLKESRPPVDPRPRQKARRHSHRVSVCPLSSEENVIGLRLGCRGG